MKRIISALLLGVAALLPVGAWAADPIRLAEDAPDSHVVVPGDTLWAISGMFLKEPWRWPEVWQLNRDEIRNPHLIYPGQVVVLDRAGPTLKLGKRIGGSGAPQGSDRPLYEKRFPQVYSDTARQAIRSIPERIIAPFLSQPLVVNDNDDSAAGIVVATQEGRVFTGAGDLIFATRIQPDTPQWHVYRKAKPLVEPFTGEILGYEAAYLGTADVTARAGVLAPEAVNADSAESGTPIPATLQIVKAEQEIGKGDRLLPATRPSLISYVPHAPETDVVGRVVSVYKGVTETGVHNVITISLGAREKMEVGHVLALFRNRGKAVYREDNVGRPENYQLPEQRYGLAFVFRVFDRVAYALVVDSVGPVTVADSVRKP